MRHEASNQHLLQLWHASGEIQQANYGEDLCQLLQRVDCTIASLLASGNGGNSVKGSVAVEDIDDVHIRS